ncbi:MAG: glycosyltransferase [Cytophagales bacterium]|nr:glycosyltransferase [Bernardetiaceae bacterium]MDW8211185.1 glycosyltransferase [Cytophagales bacterium]
MRLLIVGPAHPLRGGIAAFNERLASALQQEGHQVHILSFAYQYPKWLFPGTSQYSQEPPPQGLSIFADLHSLNPLNWWQVSQKYAAKNYHLAIFRYWLPFMAPSLGTVARWLKKTGMPIVAITDNIIPHEKRWGDTVLTRYFLKSCDGFLTMSQTVLQDLRRLEPSKPVLYSPHPLYDSYGSSMSKQQARQQLGLSPEGNYVLFFGLIRPYKGLDILLQAMADPRLASQQVHLIIAGEPYENLSAYLQQIAHLGLHNRITARWEFIPNSQVATYFCAADIVAQPYKSATQSGVAQIAYHFNRPLLVSNVGGLPEVVLHGKGGYVVNPDPNAVAEALADFFENKRYEPFAAVVAAEKHKYQWSYFTSRLMELFSKLAY